MIQPGREATRVLQIELCLMLTESNQKLSNHQAYLYYERSGSHVRPDKRSFRCTYVAYATYALS